MDAICPYCGAIVDFDSEFENLEDCGDYVEATSYVTCECGEMLRVRAFFNWDGNLEVE
jgi:hypothetical protein